MNFLKQAPPQLKTDFKEDIVKVKIDRTLWRPSSLENSNKYSCNVKCKLYSPKKINYRRKFL